MPVYDPQIPGQIIRAEMVKSNGKIIGSAGNKMNFC